MKIDNFDLDKEVLVIAEIGNNHEGKIELAAEMIQAAIKAGAAAVKFQRVRAEHLIDPKNETRFQQVRSFELSDKEFQELQGIAKENGVLFLVTPFDIGGVQALDPLVPAFKIASGDNNFYPLLEAAARTGKPIIISSGLADLRQIKKSKTFVENIWRKHKIKQELAVLHCVTSYPVPSSEVNLSAIKTLSDNLNCTIGYSDHTLGIEASVLAVALGARIIEKHFTLDKNLSTFRDHQLSSDPGEFAELVSRVKTANKMLGTGSKVPQRSEVDNLNSVRRCITATRDLPAGTLVKLADLDWLRIAGGLAPGNEAKLVGKRLKRSLSKGSLILPGDIFTRKS